MQVQCFICGREFKANPADKRKTPDLCCSQTCGYQKRKRRHPVEERFWTKVDKRGPNECWLWKASTHGYKPPYGHFHYGKDNVAHRVSWILTNGPIPPGMNVCHNCPTGDNPLCVNPAHLWLGNQSENIQDCVAKSRHRAPKGTMQHIAKLNDSTVAEIRKRFSEGGIQQIELAALYGVSKGTICGVVNRKRWKHVV